MNNDISYTNIFAAAAIVCVNPCVEISNMYPECDLGTYMDTSNELVDKYFGFKQLSPITLLENKANDIELELNLTENQRSTFQLFISSLLNEVVTNCELAEKIALYPHDEESIRIHLNHKDIVHDIVINNDGNITCSHAGPNIEPESNFLKQEQIDYTKLVSQLTNYTSYRCESEIEPGYILSEEEEISVIASFTDEFKRIPPKESKTIKVKVNLVNKGRPSRI